MQIIPIYGKMVNRGDFMSERDKFMNSIKSDMPEKINQIKMQNQQLKRATKTIADLYGKYQEAVSMYANGQDGDDIIFELYGEITAQIETYRQVFEHEQYDNNLDENELLEEEKTKMDMYRNLYENYIRLIEDDNERVNIDSRHIEETIHKADYTIRKIENVEQQKNKTKERMQQAKQQESDDGERGGGGSSRTMQKESRDIFKGMDTRDIFKGLKIKK